MKIEGRVKEVVDTVYIAEDGREFTSEEACLKHESWCRGKLLVEHRHVLGEDSYYFKASDLDTWTDALTYMGNHLVEDFLAHNSFLDFKDHWVFTRWDHQGEFTRLVTSYELLGRCLSQISELERDQGFLESLCSK